ncbi:hypothetical protein [Acetobacter ascendens]|uniref:hypothetical protein n=1 Tax=Acetobacter ascendens TaxID=481146 RepID=UPI0009E2BB92|nr:hypothetical protein [Acetobacter ascendens]
MEKFQFPEDVEAFTAGSYTFSIDVDVYDPKEFYRSAIMHYVKNNLPRDGEITPEKIFEITEEARQIVGDTIDGAIAQPCNPDTSPAGSVLQDSSTEFVSGLDVIENEPEGESFTP